MMQIIVLGMHRCGTSMAARIINLMGCYFGTEDMSLGAAFDNPKGFWERKDVVAVNDHLLNLAGGNWWEVDSLNFDGISPDDAKWVRKSIADIILKMDSQRPWFIKDPRLCLSLDFWLPALECPVFVFAHRNPLRAAQSLKKRNNIPVEYGLLLWEFYLRSMLASLKEYNYITVDYEALLQDSYGEACRLYEALIRAGIHGLKKPLRNEIEAYVDPSLWHFRKTVEETGPLRASQKELLAFIDGRKSGDYCLKNRKDELCHEMNFIKNQGNWKNSIAKSSEYLDYKVIKELQVKNEVLEERNAKLEKRNNELILRLKSVSQSRLVRFISAISRILHVGSRGLAAELTRINSIISPVNNTEELLPNKDGMSFGARALRIICGNPELVLKIMHPRRLKNAFLLLKKYKGNIRSLVIRAEQLYFHSSQDFHALMSEQICSLVSLYALPRSSKEKKAPLPDDGQVNEWVIGDYSPKVVPELIRV